jgi:hypothetical protein
MKTFQELANEAFADLLKKHGRPTDLKTALKQSLPERATMTGRKELRTSGDARPRISRAVHKPRAASP